MNQSILDIMQLFHLESLDQVQGFLSTSMVQGSLKLFMEGNAGF